MQYRSCTFAEAVSGSPLIMGCLDSSTAALVLVMETGFMMKSMGEILAE